MNKMSLRFKFLIFLTIASLTYVASEDDRMSIKDVAEALMGFAEDCDPKPEEEHIIEVLKNVEDAQYISKCFRHCLMLQFNFIQEGSTIMEKETVADMVGAMYSERKDELGEIIDICNEENKGITEKCENAHALGICMFSQMKEKGFDIPDLKDD